MSVPRTDYVLWTLLASVAVLIWWLLKHQP